MIHKNNSVAWSQFLYELEDAKAHLEKLLSDLQKDSEYSEEQFKVDLGHVYAHLNRAWNTRNDDNGAIEKNWDTMSKFPTDLEPVG